LLGVFWKLLQNSIPAARVTEFLPRDDCVVNNLCRTIGIRCEYGVAPQSVRDLFPLHPQLRQQSSGEIASGDLGVLRYRGIAIRVRAGNAV
jgi:hypothetical protein